MLSVAGARWQEKSCAIIASIGEICGLGLLVAVVLVCGACSNVRQAPVEERQEPDTAPGLPPEPAAQIAPGEPAPEEEDEQWEELPGPGRAAETRIPAQPGRISENPAVLALLDDTDLSISRDNPEAAAGSLERALRLEPKNPWLWHRLAVLKLGQGNRRLAIALAQKSNSLAAGRPELRRANADLIERASRRVGSE
ncbi:MAG: hypothetical protein OXI88_01905 [Gammaproteobacteria bacterium]|nr:hypothetical protein [Gammaproteobacteria bacterium]